MKFKKKTLKNGLRIITVPLQDAATVTAMVLVEAGSSYENQANNGLSHFLEHMCFKGTPKRPSSAIINYELDSIGSSSNAFTSNEYTGYYAKAQHSKLGQILDVISDIYLHPLLPKEEIEKEKGVVIEEINMYDDRPQSKVWDVFFELVYGRQPAGFTILGPRENIKKISQKDLIEYRKQHYVASSTVVVVAGKFDEKKVYKDIEIYFKDIPTGKKQGKKKTGNSQNVPAIKVHEKKSDQTHLVMGFRSFDLYDERIWTISLLSTLLGGGMSSRLFQKMREELGICYYVYSNNRTYTDHGMFTIAAGVGNKRTEEAVKGILEEIKKLKEGPVSAKELQKAKDYKIGNMYLGLEGSDDFADFYGFQEIYNEPLLTPEQYEKKIQAVTADDILKMAKLIFQKKKINLALVGPAKDEKNLHALLEL